MFQKKYFRPFSLKLSSFRFSPRTMDHFPLGMDISSRNIDFSLVPSIAWLDAMKAIQHKLTHNRRKAIENLVDTLIP